MKPILYAGLLGALLLVSCQTPPRGLNANQRRIAEELSAIDPWDHPRASSTPIIDVHTHTFNARYLPLRAILHGKRDAFFPVTTLISDHCATLVAQALFERTELAALPAQRGFARVADTSALRASAHPGTLCKVFLGLIDKAIAAGVWAPGVRAADAMRRLDAIASGMTLTERLAVKSAASMMGMAEHTEGGKTVEGTVTGNQAAVRFLWTLTQNDAKMASLFREMHRGAPNGGLTMVSHMMDLGPVYAQQPEHDALLDFETEQLRRMEEFKKQEGSRMIFFVAYNPYRAGSAATSSGLELVKNAVRNHGARGVKVYPPSGYRAAENVIPRRPWSFFTQHPGLQWDARYARFSREGNRELDAEVNAMLEWCMENDVPVFTHSGHGEFEARKGYGVRNSDPVFWAKFLETHSSPGKPCRLRLCLGHAGGADYWIDKGKHTEWGKKVFELCTRYPNVYCEITTDGALIPLEERAIFVERIAASFEESRQLQASGAAPYVFERKLLYGTDWYLPDKGEPAAVLHAVQSAFLHPRLRENYADYFSGNARRYLKLPHAGSGR